MVFIYKLHMGHGASHTSRPDTRNYTYRSDLNLIKISQVSQQIMVKITVISRIMYL